MPVKSVHGLIICITYYKFNNNYYPGNIAVSRDIVMQLHNLLCDMCYCPYMSAC